jgi:uncharacterized repeat protein (TIGR02543 family)
LTSITIPAGVTNIGNSAFSGCTSLTSITISESVTSIGEWAFVNCTSLTSITIPEGVTSIGEWAFYGCTTLTIQVVAASKPSGWSSDWNPSYRPVVWGYVAIVETTITFESNGGSNVSSITKQVGLPVSQPADPEKLGFEFAGWYIDQNLTTQYTFALMPNEDMMLYAKWIPLLEEDDPSDYVFTLKSDDTYEVSGYSGINTVLVIPSTYLGKPVTSIGDYAFRNLTSLTSITIPEGVTSVGYGAFFGCVSLESIFVEEESVHFKSEDGVLFDNQMTTLVSYPSGKPNFAYAIPLGIINIGDAAFAGCVSLSNITIPESVTSIGRYAFAYVTNLASINIPESLTSIGEWAFVYCASLTSITIPEGVISIGTGTFFGCTTLTIQAVADSKPSGWSSDWNIFNLPVVWGYLPS